MLDLPYKLLDRDALNETIRPKLPLLVPPPATLFEDEEKHPVLRLSFSLAVFTLPVIFGLPEYVRSWV